jgi:hypothetical protein
MPVSLDRKFRGKEDYVVQLVEQMGVETAMAMTATKHRKTFLRWLNDVTHGEWKSSPNPLAELTGGSKDKWINEHKSLIFECLSIFGSEWVKANFHLRPETLERIIRSKYKGNPATAWVNGREILKAQAEQQADASIFKILETLGEIQREQDLLRSRVTLEHDSYLEVLSQQRQLEELYYSFAENVAKRIAQALIQALAPILTQAIGPALKQLTLPKPKIVKTLGLNIIEGGNHEGFNTSEG